MSSKSKADKDRELEIKMEQAALAVAEQEQPTPTAEVNVKGLQKALDKQGIDFTTFSNADENWRKRALKADYGDMKTKYGWLYDQPIKADV